MTLEKAKEVATMYHNITELDKIVSKLENSTICSFTIGKDTVYIPNNLKDIIIEAFKREMGRLLVIIDETY